MGKSGRKGFFRKGFPGKRNRRQKSPLTQIVWNKNSMKWAGAGEVCPEAAKKAVEWRINERTV